MSLRDVIAADVTIAELPTDRRRESWRAVCRVKRSTQQFRARLKRTLGTIEKEVEGDPQFGEVAATVSYVVRILDWTIGDLERLRLPDELFEVVPVQPIVRIATDHLAT